MRCLWSIGELINGPLKKITPHRVFESKLPSFYKPLLRDLKRTSMMMGARGFWKACETQAGLCSSNATAVHSSISAIDGFQTKQ